MNPFVWYILPIAVILDLLIGDPETWPHPVRWMGSAITRIEPVFRKFPFPPLFSGFLFAVTLIAFTWGVSALLVTSASAVNPHAGTVMEIIMIYYSLSIKSLYRAAMEVSAALKKDGIEGARAKLSRIVGRDTETLDEEGVVRGAVETVAENLVDGIISPLFFAVAGGGPLAMAYKMVNTLDSMVGYKNDRYLLFGRAAARIDDVANFIPARLSVPLIAFSAQALCKTGWEALAVSFRDGLKHSSPNAGYPEAAFAGALGVKLGGPNTYKGRLVEKPWIGNDLNRMRREHIHAACQIMIKTSLMAGCIAWVVGALLQ